MHRLAITVQELDIARHVALAREHNVGIEIQVFGYAPSLLDDDWRVHTARHKALLRGFGGDIALHGAFYDMTGASPDPRVTALSYARHVESLRVAAELGARNVVFHANYLPFIRHPSYLPEWTRRQVDFCSKLVIEAERLGVVIAMENMWEPEPGIIARVLEEIDSPHLMACLDVGHVYLYSDSLPFTIWLDRLKDRLVHCHINNNQGLYDEHLPLDAPGGAIDYVAIFDLLSTVPHSPLISLEMEHLEDIERSLQFLGR